jgi:hypothetical protein
MLIFQIHITYGHPLLLHRHSALGGPKLLERNEKIMSSDESDSEEDNDADGDPHMDGPTSNKNDSIPSFRSDRRIVRWMIARCFADTLQQAFLKQLEAE